MQRQVEKLCFEDVLATWDYARARAPDLHLLRIVIFAVKIILARQGGGKRPEHYQITTSRIVKSNYTGFKVQAKQDLTILRYIPSQLNFVIVFTHVVQISRLSYVNQRVHGLFDTSVYFS